jgi:spectrin beta
MTTDISVGVRWDPLNGANGDQPMEGDFEFEYDGGNSSSRLFERSRIRALAGQYFRNKLTVLLLPGTTGAILLVFFLRGNAFCKIFTATVSVATLGSLEYGCTDFNEYPILGEPLQYLYRFWSS